MLRFRFKSGWANVPYTEGAHGAFFVVVYAGPTYFLGTESMELNDGRGVSVRFDDAILNAVKFTEGFDPFSRSSSHASFGFTVDLDRLPLDEIRRQGTMLENIDVDVHWGVVDAGHNLGQAYYLLSGKMSSPVVDVQNGKCSFGVEDVSLENDRPFPPVVGTQSRIVNLNDEDVGKPYPVVFGSVKKMPVLEISGGAGADFLIAADSIGDFSSVVSEMYVGDGPNFYGAGAQSSVVDTDGNTYWKASPAVPAGSDRNVTANLTGHAANTPGKIIRDLISFYSDHSKAFDVESITRLDRSFGGVEMSMMINYRADGGVFRFIRDRIGGIVPFVVIQRGDKQVFAPVEWHQNATKKIVLGVNAIRKTKPPMETSKRQVYSSFATRFGRSGFRGDSLGVVERNHTNDALCKIAYDRFGDRAYPDLDMGDVVDEASAAILLDWFVKTFARVRVMVSYECTMDAVDVDPLDVVEVFDEEEGWTHGPLFLVTRKTYTTGTTFVLHLISVEDYSKVYRVNVA